MNWALGTARATAQPNYTWHWYSIFVLFSEFVGNIFPPNGDLYAGFSQTSYIINSDAITIPFEGYIHAFHAQIKVADEEVRFQIWRVDSATRNATLIGEESFTTTTDQTNSLRSEVGWNNIILMLMVWSSYFSCIDLAVCYEGPDRLWEFVLNPGWPICWCWSRIVHTSLRELKVINNFLVNHSLGS